jgi:hypothetical protein
MLLLFVVSCLQRSGDRQRHVDQIIWKQHSPKLASVLAQLADAYAMNGHQAIDEYRASGVITDAQDRVRVQILGEPGRRLIVPAQTLATHGVEIIAASDNVIEAYVPINQLDTLADASSVIWSISLPPRPR